MVGRASSPVLAGRAVELDELEQAVRRSLTDERRVIVVEGEAGIGKSRLLRELVNRVAPDEGSNDGVGPRYHVAWGRPTQLSDSTLPYGPIVEVLDHLAGLEPDDGRAALRRLRDDLSGAIELPGASAASRGRLFLELRRALATVADARPLLVVLDDLHWADRSTLDLLAYLAPRLAGTGITLVLAFRSDEIHRRHPLRPPLSELQRGWLLERLTLAPLDADAAEVQVRAIAGDDSDETFVRRVIELGDGNPYHIEELVALGGSWRSMPPTLRDVTLSRLERLDAATLGVVRTASVIGRDFGAELLASVSGHRAEELIESLRTAVSEHVLLPSGDGLSYRFRHALLREAVYEDILPADRVVLHRAVADALDADTSPAAGRSAGAAAELARHRDAGQQPTLARAAYSRAADLAMRARAWSEAAAAYERVLALDAGAGRPSRDLPLVRAAMRAIWFAGRPRQAEALLRTALEDEGADFDPLTVTEGWIDISRILNDIGDDPGSWDALARARAIVPRHPPTRVRARVAGAVASNRYADARYRDAIRLASPAIDLADRLGAHDVGAEARAHRSGSLMALGHRGAALRDADAARAIALELDDPDSLNVALFNSAVGFLDVGELEEGLRRLLEASAICRDLGLEEAADPWIRASAADFCFWLGRWDEADQHLAAAHRLDVRGTPLTIAACVEANLAAYRSRSDHALRAVAEAADASPPRGFPAVAWRTALARVRLRTGNAAGALAAIDDALTAAALTDDVYLRAHIASLGAEAAADLAQYHAARRDPSAADVMSAKAQGFAGFAVELDEGRVVRGSIGSPHTQAHRAFAAAHAARAAGRGEPDPWLVAAELFDDIAVPPLAAWSRFWAGDAAVELRDREAAAAALREALAAAIGIGDVVLSERIAALARRARLDVSSPEATELTADESGRGRSANPWRLSDRELEVLELVGQGMTNREIAQRLFITPKTASSHVAHILDKIGALNRTEAALIAARAGILGEHAEASARD